MSIPFLSLHDVTALHADEIRDAAKRVIDSGWYLQGEENKRFEQHFAQYVGSKYCVGCANGLDALIWILRAYKELGILNDGDEIIVPANTFIATILAITENGLTPVFVEPRYETLEINDDLIEDRITDRTRAIMLVHLYGRNAYSYKIGELCQKYNLLLIQDCAQCHGLKTLNSQLPAHNSAAYSFYPGKNLGALGDGGAVVTDDEALANTIRTLANYGSHKKYVFDYQGRNSRLDEIQAAVLDVKLKYLDEDNAQRQKIANYYYDNINNPLVTLPSRLPDSENVYHIFPVLCEQRDQLQQYLSDNKVGTVIHYPIPPHMQKCYANESWNTPTLSFPITERIAREELSLPISPAMTLEEAEQVVLLINAFNNK